MTKQTKQLNYPMVACDAHPGIREPGYAVCNHVINGTPIGWKNLATKTELGTIACWACYAMKDQPGYILKHFVFLPVRFSNSAQFIFLAGRGTASSGCAGFRGWVNGQDID
jgi:hypothetical protein